MRNNQSNAIMYRKYIAQLASTYRNRSDIRMFVEILLTVTAIFMFSVFAIRPTLITIGGLTTEITEKKETIKTMDTKIANIILAQEVFTKENTRLQLLATAVPSEPSVASALKEIEAVAKAHSVSIFTLNTTNIPVSVSEESEQKISLAVTFTGEYSALQATLKDLESLRRPILVNSSALSLDQSGESTQIYLTVAGDLPYFPVIATIQTP